jgi:aryl-alcohol dehydrogenase-like predicted oxidoreductase
MLHDGLSGNVIITQITNTMEYRNLCGVAVSRLGYGTSTFVQGKLRPHADSAKGKECLNVAIDSGINIIHSNPNLGTQWAIREVLDRYLRKSVYHLVKIELPLVMDLQSIATLYHDRLQYSRDQLGCKSVHGIVYEIDRKRTPPDLLEDKDALQDNYAMIRTFFDRSRQEGQVFDIFCMTKNRLEMVEAMQSRCFDGYAGYFTLFDTWPAEFFDDIATRRQAFIGVKPLKHGILTSGGFKHELPDGYAEQLYAGMGCFMPRLKEWFNAANPIGPYQSVQELAIAFSLAHPVVKTVIVGTTNHDHLDQLMTTEPMPLDQFSAVKTAMEHLRWEP